MMTSIKCTRAYSQNTRVRADTYEKQTDNQTEREIQRREEADSDRDTGERKRLNTEEKKNDEPNE